jgi:hypothetical protein
MSKPSNSPTSCCTALPRIPARRRCDRSLTHRRRLCGWLLVAGLSAANVKMVNASTFRALPGNYTAVAAPQRLEYAWLAPLAGSQNSLGTITVHQADGRPGVTLLTPSLHATGNNLVCQASSWGNSGKRLNIIYAMGSLLVSVVVAIESTPTSLQATVDADRPGVASVDMGPWATGLQAKPIAVPYYTGSLWYLPDFKAYVNAWWDWHTTHATRLQGTTARYLPRTDRTLSTMHEVLMLVVSPDLDAALPSPGNSASPYRAELSGRLVLDIWNKDFQRVERGFTALADYGITNCIAIIHVWQHEGFDNALPEHYPANEAMGGEAGLVSAMNAGKADGCLMALHENYIDYYPNYPKFDPAAIALTSDGKWLTAWLNHSTGVQSYSAKPAWMLKNASLQSPEIHRRYATTAAYLDVNSSAPPSGHGDMDARAPGGGTLGAWLAGDSALWSYERKTHGGPVLGEGGNHWFYSGLLDGVEAQLGAGSVPGNLGAQVPLFVDFDLKRIHPLQVNHGMGYYGRWLSNGEKISDPLNIDAYRMQEIAFGHAPFVGTEYWDDIAYALVESNLVTPVAKRYGVASVSSIAYQVDGAWVSPSVAAVSGSFERVRVTYNDGLVVVANASRQPLRWQELELPQFGWAAKGQGLLAYTAICGNTLCDYAETSTSVFANARNQADARDTGAFAAPSVTDVERVGPGSFSITSHWLVNKPMNNNYKIFLHFVDDGKLATNSGVAFQGSSDLAEPTSRWTVGKVATVGPLKVQIPSSVQDGIYSIRIGLVDPGTGNRVPLVGLEDGSRRYIVGHLNVTGEGNSVSFEPVLPFNDSRLNSAGVVVGLGTVKTDGMVSISENEGLWVLRPFPRSRDFTVLLNKSKFAMPATVRADGGSTPLLTPADQGTYWRLPLTGAKSYTWPAAKETK